MADKRRGESLVGITKSESSYPPDDDWADVTTEVGDMPTHVVTFLRHHQYRDWARVLRHQDDWAVVVPHGAGVMTWLSKSSLKTSGKADVGRGGNPSGDVLIETGESWRSVLHGNTGEHLYIKAVEGRNDRLDFGDSWRSVLHGNAGEHLYIQAVKRPNDLPQPGVPDFPDISVPEMDSFPRESLIIITHAIDPITGDNLLVLPGKVNELFRKAMPPMDFRRSLPKFPVLPKLPDFPAIASMMAGREYSRAVGAHVAELIDRIVAEHPGIAASVSPEMLAQTLVEVAIDPDGDRSELADLLAPFWSAKRAQEALGGLSRATMHDRRRTGSLLGVMTTDGDIFYPVAQFEAHGGNIRVKPGLRSFMMALRHRDPWTVAVLLHTPADELQGFTPLEWVRQGRDTDNLVAYARIVDAEFSR